MKSDKFILSSFSSYRDVIGQYKDTYIKNSSAVKIREDDSCVEVCVAAGRSSEVVPFLKDFHAPKNILVITVSDSEFAEFIGNIVDSHSETETIEEKSNFFSLETVSESAPVVNIINATCLEAVRRGASDIHIQCESEQVRIRFRIDGVLQTVRSLQKAIFQSLSSRIKVMSNLNIMEQRLPQDGHMTVRDGETALDFRVSVVPNTYGESIVLRLFDMDKSVQSLSQLGFSEETYRTIKKSSAIPNGLVIVTGPTGSGKTTTLHALLSELDSEKLKIITIEDPVEKALPHIDQIQVNDAIGLTFENILSKILRQDPDVIMVGEIRDNATAQLAVRAALTGHLIFSTLHTNDSISAVSRLRNMGVEPYLIASVLKFSSAQRLVRKVCPHCAKEVPITSELRMLANSFSLSGNSMKEAVGCEKCLFMGYKGRTAVSEIFEIDSEERELIEEKKGDSALHALLEQKGMRTLKEDALRKVLSGETTFSEIMREGLL